MRSPHPAEGMYGSLRHLVKPILEKISVATRTWTASLKPTNSSLVPTSLKTWYPRSLSLTMPWGLIPKSGWFSPRWRPEEARFSRENEGFPQWSFHPDSTQHLKIGCPILTVINASRFKARVYVCVAIAAFWDRARIFLSPGDRETLPGAVEYSRRAVFHQHYGASPMRIIDLSAPIAPSPPDAA